MLQLPRCVRSRGTTTNTSTSVSTGDDFVGYRPNGPYYPWINGSCHQLSQIETGPHQPKWHVRKIRQNITHQLPRCIRSCHTATITSSLREQSRAGTRTKLGPSKRLGSTRRCMDAHADTRMHMRMHACTCMCTHDRARTAARTATHGRPTRPSVFIQPDALDARRQRH